MESRWIRVGEINTHYLVGGEGRPLVLVHGGGSCAEDEWTPNLEALAQHHRIYAPDLVGYGKTDKPAVDYDLPLFSSFFEDFMNALDLGSVSLMGHSLGGGVALAFALKHPDRVEKLGLVDSAGFGEEGTLLGNLLAGFFTLRATVRNDRTYPSLVRNRAIYKVYPADDLLGLATPTLIIWGERDHYLPVRLAHRAHTLIRNSQLRVFKGCHHAPQKEKPEEFNRLVLDFLREEYGEDPAFR